MDNFENIYRVDLATGKPAEVSLKPMFYGDALANRVGARVYKNGAAVSLVGSCAGEAILSTGGTVALTGTISDGMAYVDLPAACYAVQGKIEIFVNWTSGSKTVTLVHGFGNVRLTDTGTVIDPGTVIDSVSDLIDAIDEAVSSIPSEYSDLLATIAPDYDDLTFPVAAGDQCWYSGTLYRAKADILSSETWTAAHWEASPAIVEQNTALQNGVEDTHSCIAASNAALGRNGMDIPWEKHAYIHATTGAVKKTSNDVSVTGLIQIPYGAKAVITSTASTVRYATYDKNGSLISVYTDAFGINIVISSADAAFFRLQYSGVTDSALATAQITFEYADGLARISDLEGKTGFSSEYATKTGNPISVDNAAKSALSSLEYSGSASGEIIDLCGKNMFHFQHKSNLGLTTNAVTFHFNMETQVISIDSEGASADAISASSSFDGGCTTLDGVTAYHNFHFRMKADTPVTITPNYSYDPYYDDKVQLQLAWAENGAVKLLAVGYEGATIVAHAGVEYGIRVRVSEGFSGSVTLKPQVEIGSDSTEYEQYSGAECLLDAGAGSANAFSLTQKNRLVTKLASDKITVNWLYALNAVRIIAEAPASNTIVYHPDYDGTVNSASVNYIFKFTPGNVPVSVSGVPEELVGLVIIQIVDGTNITNIRTADPYLFVADANTEYGYRVYVKAGSSFDYTIKPVIATGAEALKQFGSHHPVTTIYTDKNAVLTVKYATATKNEKTADAGRISEGVNILTAGKIIHPFEKLKKFPPVVTFIDDDTTSPTLVERFHDIFAAEGVVGNYAVEMRNVQNYSETMPEMLLGYEEEGFGMLYHCWKQDGDADRYWESGNPAYDEDLIRENFYRGLRAYRQMGFHSDKYWVTPYGVNDEFIRSLAKEADMECLLSCPTGTYACNAIMNLGSNVSRWNMPRWIFLSNSDNDYQGKALIDGCAETNGWLCIVTHVNSWPAGSVETNTQRLTGLIQYAKAAGCEIWNFNRAFKTFKPLLMLNELF